MGWLKAATASSATFFNLQSGASQNISFISATDINSSGGQSLWDYKGTLLRTVNWNLLTAPATISYAFVD